MMFSLHMCLLRSQWSAHVHLAWNGPPRQVQKNFRLQKYLQSFVITFGLQFWLLLNHKQTARRSFGSYRRIENYFQVLK